MWVTLKDFLVCTIAPTTAIDPMLGSHCADTRSEVVCMYHAPYHIALAGFFLQRGNICSYSQECSPSAQSNGLV